MNFYILSLIKAGLLAFVFLTALAYLQWIERKVLAHIQLRVGPRRVFQQRDFIRVAADQRVRGDPLKRRAFLGIFVDAVLIQRYGNRKFARGDQFADQRVAFAEVYLLRGETTPVIQPSFLAACFHQSAEEIILFRIPTELTFPARLKQILVALRHGVGCDQLGIVADHVDRLMQAGSISIRVAPLGRKEKPRPVATGAAVGATV